MAIGSWQQTSALSCGNLNDRIAAMNELPLDYTRCMGMTPECPQRHNCARHRSVLFADRLSWRRNMNDAGVEQQCLSFIPWKETND